MASLLDNFAPRRACSRSGGASGLAPADSWLGLDQQHSRDRAQLNHERETVTISGDTPASVLHKLRATESLAWFTETIPSGYVYIFYSRLNYLHTMWRKHG